MVVEPEQIVSIIRNNGPLLPAKLAKSIGTDILIASAHLAYLVDSKKVLISKIKVGGSPVYYLDGQQEKLQEFSSNLNEKDQKTLSILKSKKILRDDQQEPLTKLSLRTIKDFAIPLQVTAKDQKILFWKWYLISNKDAEGLIRRELEPKPESPKPAPEKPDTWEEEKKKLQQERKQMERKLQEEKSLMEKKEEEHIAKKRLEEKNTFEEEKRKLEEEKRKIEQERKQMRGKIEEERQSLLEEIKKSEKPPEKPKPEDPFLSQIQQHFAEKNIQILESKIIRKNAEIDLILKIPSAVGNLEFYCKSKNKKNLSDADLSSAIVQGQLKKLPTLLLTTGELSKKAKELLNTELHKSITIKKI